MDRPLPRGDTPRSSELLFVRAGFGVADASVHMVENPTFPGFLHGQEVLITVVLLLILGCVFLLGFSEAIGVAIPLVAVFLALNTAIVRDAVSAWTDRLTQNSGGFFGIVGPAVLARFPCWCWVCPGARPARSPTSRTTCWATGSARSMTSRAS